jgi:4-hydroxy-tetrahydrodipicolinate synthase
VGVQALPLTPFSESGQIDEAAFRKELEFCIESGVDGFVVGVKIGEARGFGTDEKKRLIEIAVDQVKGRVLIGLGIISLETDLAVELAKAVERLGGDYVMVSPPYPDSGGMLAWLEAIASAVGISLMLYDCVYGPWGHKIMSIEEVILPLASRFENVKASKTTDPPETVLTLKEKTSLNVLCGWDMMALLDYQYGADGVVAGAAALVPRESAEVHRLIAQGNLGAVRDICYDKVLPILNLVRVRSLRCCSLQATFRIEGDFLQQQCAPARTTNL